MTHSSNYFSDGDSNTICERSGFKCKMSETLVEWNGLRVRADFFEERQPQDLPVTPRPQRVFNNVRVEPPIKPYTIPTPEELLNL